MPAQVREQVPPQAVELEVPGQVQVQVQVQAAVRQPPEGPPAWSGDRSEPEQAGWSG